MDFSLAGQHSTRSMRWQKPSLDYKNMHAGELTITCQMEFADNNHGSVLAAALSDVLRSDMVPWDRNHPKCTIYFEEGYLARERSWIFTVRAYVPDVRKGLFKRRINRTVNAVMQHVVSIFMEAWKEQGLVCDPPRPSYSVRIW